MPRTPLKLSLTIDGVPREFPFTLAQVQSDPYPGGHTYELRMTGRLAAELRALAASTRPPFGWKETQAFFSALHWAELRAGPRAGDGGPSFILNTVETVSLRHDSFMVQGVCSPVVRSPAESQ